MSNGPASSRRSFHSLRRWIVAASIASTESRMCTRENPSRFIPRSPRLSWLYCCLTTRIPKSRSGRDSLRSPATLVGTLRTIATARQSCSRARWTRLLRASAWTLVASTTVRRPRASRFPRDVAQHVEGVARRVLVVLVVGDQTATEVGRHHLRGQEVLARERRLAGPRHTDEHHETQLGDIQCGHRVNTPICVGAPTSASTVPTGSNSTSYPWRSATAFAHAWNCARVHSKR